MLSDVRELCDINSRQNLEVVAAVHEVTVDQAADIIYNNVLSLYFPWELCFCLFMFTLAYV